MVLRVWASSAHIAKRHSNKQRPLGLPPWSDKLVQEVIRSILEAYYEPRHGPRPVLQVSVARGDGKPPLLTHWGGIRLARTQKAVALDDDPHPIYNTHSELLERLLAQRCEVCGATDHIEVHPIRALKDLKRKGRAERPKWVEIMAARRRKTLVLCQKCHKKVHAGRANQPLVPT